jgi:hypothetical protein
MSDNNAREMAETQKNIYRQKTDMAMAGQIQRKSEEVPLLS